MAETENMDAVLGGPAAPPSANGELTFESPWQARLFGMAWSLCNAGVFEWEEFRARLIEAVGEWDSEPDSSETYDYYVHFEAALLAVLKEKGVDLAGPVLERTEVLAARPHGHDHLHSHNH